MSESIEPSLFDFVDEFAEEVRKGDLSPLDTLAANSRIITFCEGFFVQFFANVLGREIDGFDPQAKRLAAGLAIELQDDEDDEQRAPVRALIGLFEKFCDMYADIIGGAYGAAEITYASFHRRYVGRLLRRAAEWAGRAELQELESRIVQSRRRYEDAVKSRKW